MRMLSGTPVDQTWRRNRNSAQSFFHTQKENMTRLLWRSCLRAAVYLMGKATTPKSIIATAQLPTALTTGFSAESYVPACEGAFVGYQKGSQANCYFDATVIHRKWTTLCSIRPKTHCACPVIEARKFPPFEWIDAVVRLIGKGGWIILDSYCWDSARSISRNFSLK